MRISCILAALAACLAFPAAAQPQPDTPAVVRPAPPGPFTEMTVGAPRCDLGANKARLPVSAAFALGPEVRQGAKVALEIAVNGAGTGAFGVPVEIAPGAGRSVRFAREVEVPANRPEALLRLSVNGTTVGAVQTVKVVCITAVTPTIPVSDSPLWRPDLQAMPMVIASYRPSRPVRLTRPCAICPPTLRVVSGPSWPALLDTDQVETDLRRPLRLFEATAASCTRENEAFVTVLFFVGIRTDGVHPVPYFQHERLRFYEFVDDTSPDLRQVPVPPAYIDTRSTTFSVEPGYRPLPVGYEWAVFDRVLPCTRAGTIDFVLDPDNRLQESNEGNNVLRIKFATFTPPG